jgi:hypothetical protein
MSDISLSSPARRDLLAAIDRMFPTLTLRLAPNDPQARRLRTIVPEPIDRAEVGKSRIRYQPASTPTPPERSEASYVSGWYRDADCRGDLLLTFSEKKDPKRQFTIVVPELGLVPIESPPGSEDFDPASEMAGMVWQRIEEFLCFSTLDELAGLQTRI